MKKNIKRIISAGLSFIAVGVVLIMGPGSAQAAVNLILNPELQIETTPGVPDNWHAGGFNVAFTADYPVAGPGGAGDKAMMLTVASTTGGDAKWIFDNVVVEPGALYTFSDWYNANVPTSIVAAFAPTGTTTPTLFNTLALVPSTGGAWASTSQQFTVPIGYSLVAVWHTIGNIGTLTTDNYSLTLTATAAENLFPAGMVSLTFDDGWITQYDAAKPILQNANMNGTFYIFSDGLQHATQVTSDNLLSPVAHPDVSVTTAPTSTIWTGVYADPTGSPYRFTDSYSSAADGTITISYTPLGGSSTTIVLGAAPASPTSTRIATFIFSLPLLATSSITTLAHTVPTGTLTIQSSTLTVYDDYMNSAQMLEMQAAGNEIGDHTASHCNLVTGLCPETGNSVDPLTAAQEINNAKSVLISYGAAPIDTLAYPYGAYNDIVKTEVTNAGISAARSIDDGYNTLRSDKLALKIKPVVAVTTLDQVKGWVDTAITNRWWLVLMFHQVDTVSLPNNVTPTMFQDIISYIGGKPIQVKTVRQAAALINPDLTPPVITLNGNATTSLAVGQTFTDPGATALDNVDGNISANIATSSDVLVINTSTTTTFHLFYNVSDAAGNAAVTAIRTVIVADLVISAEQQATTTPSATSITINWTTSHPATSRVIYDSVSHSNASTSAAVAPNYGYANSTVEDAATTTNHTVVVGGLSPATTYYFRPVSHGSPEMVGSEISAATIAASTPPPSGGGGGGSSTLPPPAKPAATTAFIVIPPASSGQQVLGEKIDNTAAVTAEEISLLGTIDMNLVRRLAGRVLLQVERFGQAWYLDVVSLKKYYLSNGDTAYQALRKFGLGITNADLAKIPIGMESRFTMTDTDNDGLPDKLEESLGTDQAVADSDYDGANDGVEMLTNKTNPLGAGKLVLSTSVANRLKGRILLQVESRGEAWYVNPADGKRYYMNNGEAAYQIMRYLSLGITDADIHKIPVGSF